MKKRILYMLTALVLTVFMLYAAFAVKSERTLASEMVRLRVIASSDSRENQEIKLRVRDRLLERVGNAGYETRGEALDSLKTEEEELEALVGSWLSEEGVDYGAEVSVGNVLYPTSVYETFSLPAGNYTALTVTLGEGQGHNWWCVLFPPLCYGAAPEEDAIESSAILWEDGENVEIRFRFRVLEWIEKLKEKLREEG